MNNLPDIEKELEEKRAYHSEQLDKINKALRAVRGNATIVSEDKSVATTKRPKRVRWTKHIMSIFNTSPSSKFSPLDIRELLEEKGLPVETTGNKNAIYTTIARLVEKDKIEKVETGLYQKKAMD